MTLSTTNGYDASSLPMRLSRLLHPAFVAALAVLIANDWLFKPLLHNALTGKLSDFAGLFAFAYFWSVVAGRKTAAIHALTAIAFAIWKSPLAQPAIDAWNALGAMQIARVIDPSDLFAIAALPLSYWLSTKTRAASVAALPETTTVRFAKFAVAGIALVAFTATSKRFDNVAIEADYLSARTVKQIGEIAERDDTDAVSAYNKSLSVRFELDDCDKTSAQFTAHTRGKQTILRLRSATGSCSGEGLERDALLAALDPLMNEHFGAQRVKAGVGVLGEQEALTTPAQPCPTEADKTSKKSKRANDGDSTYPPKKRARHRPEDNPEPPLTDPAASPETPSPSATRNSN